LRAGSLAGVPNLIKCAFPLPIYSSAFSRRFNSSEQNNNPLDEFDISEFTPLDPKQAPKGLPSEYFNPKATPLVLLPNEIIEEKLQKFHRAVMNIGINDVVKKSKYDLVREFEEKGLIKISPQLAKKLVEESINHEDSEGLNFWELMSGGVVATVVLIILYLIIFPPEHPVRPAEYPYLRIRAKKFPWGDVDLFDALSLKLFGHDKYAHHGHGHGDDHGHGGDHGHDDHHGGASHEDHDDHDDHDDHASHDEQTEDHDEGEH
jgi:hypothetical protein